MTAAFLFDVTSWDDWREALGEHGWNIVVILAIVFVAELLLQRLARRIIRAVIRNAPLRTDEDRLSLQRRADTLGSTLHWVLGIVLFFVGLTLVLDEIGISVAALVAGVGVVGIAIGLGAQALVRDVINGTFILVEDQFRVGDVVTVANVSGTVIAINPRRTILRDGDGNVHSIPNGVITIATNQTAGFSRLNFEIPVTYSANLDRVFELIREEIDRLRSVRPDFLSEPVIRVSGFQENRVLIRVMADVTAGKHWELAALLRLSIKSRLDAEGLWMAGAPAAPDVPAPVPSTAQPPSDRDDPAGLTDDR